MSAVDTASDRSYLYWYSATVTEVYDGDTITVDLDYGFGQWTHGLKLRLAGIDTPEVRGEERPEGLIARDWMREQLLGREVVVNTEHDRSGKYGRTVAWIWLGERCINDELVNAGMAERREY